MDDLDGLIPWPRLQQWVSDHSKELPGSGPVTGMSPLQGGAQNVVLQLSRQGGDFVLRRPPRHLRANSNETMRREARVLRALAGSDVPHARVYAACDDPDVIGASFYAMQLVNGFTPVGQMPAHYDVAWRREMSFNLVAAAARLGTLDPAEIGLADFGRAENWAARQVDRWGSQLAGYSDLGYQADLDLAGVGRWLTANLPPDTRIGVIHGDLQWANTMFDRDSPKLVAIIDWELSSLGDPLLDLGWILTSWIEDGDPPGHEPQLTPTEGLPSRAELIARYAEVSGRETTHVTWFFVLACYKLAILLEGTWARAQAGKAPMPMGQMLHDYAGWLHAKAEQLIAHA